LELNRLNGSLRHPIFARKPSGESAAAFAPAVYGVDARIDYDALRDTRTTPAQINAIPITLAGVMLSPSHITDTAATTT
jgi:hypothetical protein